MSELIVFVVCNLVWLGLMRLRDFSWRLKMQLAADALDTPQEDQDDQWLIIRQDIREWAGGKPREPYRL